MGIKINSAITLDDLEAYGRTDIVFNKLSENEFYLNFSVKKTFNNIKKIKIERFKNIKDVSVDIKTINLLIGGNNSGKSSFLQALHFGISCGQSLEKYISDKKTSTTLNYDELFYRPINNIKNLGHYGNLGRKRDDKNNKEDKHIKITYFNQLDKEVSIDIETGRARGPSLGVSINDRNDFTETLFNLKNNYSYYVTGVAGILGSESLLSPALIKEAAVKGSSNSVFRNIIYLLSKNSYKYKLFTLYLNRIFPNITLKIIFNEIEDKEILIEASNNGETYYSIDSFGTSLLQIIQIFSYIFLFNPSIIILDEPDAHLHPDNQIKIIKNLYEISKIFNIQLIISTHSKHILDYMLPSSNIIWINNGEIQKYISEDSQYLSLLSDIGALSDIKNLNNWDVLILTEDSDIKMLEVILESSGFDMLKTGIWSYKTCSQLKNIKIVSEFMKSNFPQLKLIVHRDRDFAKQDFLDSLIENFKAINVDLFITDQIDIESYFCNPQHINHLYPELTLTVINNAITNYCINNEQNIKANSINCRNEFYVNNRTFFKKFVAPGEIYQEIETEFKITPLSLVKGKTLLNFLKNDLKSKTSKKNNLDLIKSSEFLKNEILYGLNK